MIKDEILKKIYKARDILLVDNSIDAVYYVFEDLINYIEKIKFLEKIDLTAMFMGSYRIYRTANLT